LKTKEKTERQLVNLCQKGEEEAFEELLSRHSQYIRGWISKFSKGDGCFADEIYQITIIKCWQKIGGFKGKSTFKTWATAIARNVFYDEYRRSTRRKFYDIDMADTNSEFETMPDFSLVENRLPSQEMQHKENIQYAKKITKQIFGRLKSNYAEVLRLRDGENLEYKEIAKILNVPLGTVMSRLFYARKKVMLLIKKNNYKLTSQ